MVYTKIVEGGSEIVIATDNEAVQVSKDRFLVNESDAVRHIVKYPLEVWGEGDGQHALVTAEWENYAALLEVNIKSKPEVEEKGDKGHVQ